MFSIAGILDQLKTKSKVDLEEKKLDDDQIKEIVAVLSENTRLDTLNLSVNRLGAKGARVLASLVKNKSTLTFLDLSINALGDEGARAIADVLPGLDFLNLQHNGITDIGALALVKGLKRRLTPVLVLMLDNNPIGDNGARHFALLLKENNSARSSLSLGLEKTQITDAGVIALAAALRDNTDLAAIYLRDNQITDVGAAALCEVLAVNYTLRELTLTDNPIQNQDLMRKIENLIKRNEDFHKAHNIIRENLAAATSFIEANEFTSEKLEQINEKFESAEKTAQQLQTTEYPSAKKLIADIQGTRAFYHLQQGEMIECLRLYRSVLQEQPPEATSLALAERLVAENFSDPTEFSPQEKWTLILGVLRGQQSPAAKVLQSQARHFLRTGRVGFADSSDGAEDEIALLPLVPLIDKLIVAFSPENQTKRIIRNFAFTNVVDLELNDQLSALKVALLAAVPAHEFLKDFNQLLAASQRVIQAIAGACDQETPDYDKIEQALTEYQKWEKQNEAVKTFVSEIEAWVENKKTSSPSLRR